jgi:hypothetical protein
LTAPAKWEAKIALTGYHCGDTPVGTVEMDPNVEPRHLHDCEGCRFLGRLGDCDIYVCGPKAPLPTEIVVRRGSKGWEYSATSLDEGGLSLGGGFWLTGLREIGASS